MVEFLKYRITFEIWMICFNYGLTFDGFTTHNQKRIGQRNTCIFYFLLFSEDGEWRFLKFVLYLFSIQKSFTAEYYTTIHLLAKYLSLQNNIHWWRLIYDRCMKKKYILIILLVLLSANIKILSVSRMQEFSKLVLFKNMTRGRWGRGRRPKSAEASVICQGMRALKYFWAIVF